MGQVGQLFEKKRLDPQSLSTVTAQSDPAETMNSGLDSGAGTTPDSTQLGQRVGRSELGYPDNQDGQDSRQGRRHVH